MNGSIIALNITTEDLKYAEINYVGGDKILRAAHHVPFAREDEDVGDLLRKLIAEKKPLSPKTLLIISSQDLTYKEFTFPFGSQKKVISAIRFEVSSEYPLEEYLLDGIEIITREAGKKAFIAAVAKKEMLRRRIRAAEEAGLQIVGITSDLSTLGNYYMDEDEALVMETGERHTLFALLSHGLPVLMRDIPIGRAQIHRGIEKSDEKGVRSLMGEIRRTIHSFNVKADQDMNKIHVSGNILLERTTFETLKKSMDVQFEDGTTSNGKFKAEENAHPLNVYASLLGAAWWQRRDKSFNFLKEEFAESEPGSIGQQYFRWGAILAAAMLFVFLSSSLLNIVALQKREKFLTKEIRKSFVSAFPETKKFVDEVKQAKNFLNARLMDLGGINPSARTSFLDILEILSRTIPAETKFEIVNLFCEKGKVEIGGRTDSFKSVNAIQEVLIKSGHFSEVIISNAKSRDDGQLVEVTITIRFEG